MNRKIKSICAEGDTTHFKGLNAVLAMVQRLSSEGTEIEYHCGLAGTELTSGESNKYSMGPLPVTLTRWADFPPGDDCLPFSAIINDLKLPSYV